LPKITILIGFSFVELSTVDSTNNYAMAMIHEGMATHGMAVFAHAQTAGKGQRGKHWTSEPGSNIILSVLVDASPIRHLPPFALSAASALACHELFAFHTTPECSIKWPNDIYWRDRKAGGILIENVYRGKEWQWAVIGIGLNVNQTRFPDLGRPPVSLKQITGKTFDAVVLAKDLCALLETCWQELAAGRTDAIYSRYQDLLYKRGELVRLRKDETVFEAYIQGVGTDGRLRTGHNGETGYSVGEVEWMFDH
jgi:BirA family transcriptional regulator, biotin operon repressor / biotin---[acetyl-CoA-carboxylase] ligase